MIKEVDVLLPLNVLMLLYKCMHSDLSCRYCREAVPVGFPSGLFRSVPNDQESGRATVQQVANARLRHARSHGPPASSTLPSTFFPRATYRLCSSRGTLSLLVAGTAVHTAPDLLVVYIASNLERSHIGFARTSVSASVPAR